MSDTAVAWATDTQPATANPVARVHDSFGEDGLARARKRTVEQSGPHSWLVHGDARLGDSYPEYAVTLAPGDRKYTCACYFHGGGDVRRAKVCSHVKAVVLWRAKRKSVERAKARLQDRGRDVPAQSESEPPPAGLLVSASLPQPSDEMFGDPPLPSWLTAFRPHQWTAVEQILAAYERGAKVVFVNAPTGCLAGDTDIIVNRGGAGRHYRLSDVVLKFNGGRDARGRRWDPTITTMVQRNVGGVVRLCRLLKAYDSGDKETFRLRTEAGREIRATVDHRFLTVRGWKKLGRIEVGDELYVNVGQGLGRAGRPGKMKSTPGRKKAYYSQVHGLFAHPHATQRNLTSSEGRGYTVPFHRLVAEARINGLGDHEYIGRIRDGNVDGLTFLDPAIWAVHHQDEDPQHNDRDNLTVLTHEEHGRLHALQGMANNVAYQVGLDRVESITRHGVEPTFDLMVEDDPHNFIANEFVVHNSGKTIIGELSRRLASTSALYVCSTKHLQQQIAGDFEYMPVLKGRANYTPTDAIATNLWGEKDARGTVATCADCTRTRGSSTCKWCVDVNRCPYVVAKEDALHSPVAVLNTSYFLAEANGPGRFAKRDLVVCDEADLLEGELMSAVEVRVSKARQKQLHIKPPARKTIESTWVDWVGVTLPIVEQRMRELGPVERLEKPAHIREAKGLSTLYAKLLVLAEELPKGGWVYDMDRGDIVFKPVKVDRYGPSMLWAHGQRFLLMSGTIISAQQMAQDLGLKDRWEVVDVPMTFPVQNRPVRIGAVVSMTNRDKEVAWPKMCQAVSKLVGLRPGKRMLVHTVSYQLAQEVAEVLRRDHPGRKIITYAEGRAKEAAIASYKEHEGAVIVAPSMDRGVDLPDDLCEVTVVAKVPYPNLGDKQVNARLHSQGGQGWYAVQTVRSIMQMCGRGVRSETDRCETFILDHQFTANVWARNRRLFPAWFVDALDWRFDHRSLTT